MKKLFVMRFRFNKIYYIKLSFRWKLKKIQINLFKDTEDNCDIRVWGDYEINLPDTRQTDFDYEYTELGGNPSVAHAIFALTEDITTPLNPVIDNLGSDMFSKSNLYAVFVYHYFARNTGLLGLWLIVKQGNQSQLIADRIPIDNRIIT